MRTRGAPELFPRVIERDPINRRGGHSLCVPLAYELQRLAFSGFNARGIAGGDHDPQPQVLRCGFVLFVTKPLGAVCSLLRNIDTVV